MEGNTKSSRRALIFKICVCVILFVLVIEMIVNITVHDKMLDIWGRMVRKEVELSSSLLSTLELQIQSNSINKTENITTSNVINVGNITTSNVSSVQMCPEKPPKLVRPLGSYVNEESKKLFTWVKPGDRYTPKNFSLHSRTNLGPLGTYRDALSYEELKKLFPWVKPGGRYTPQYCIPRHRTAIIIPFRNREKHLKIFLHNIHPFLQRQYIDYGIFVINQVEGSKFNRAMLMNIGYAEAIKTYNYSCFIFHDVDLIPEDDRNIYGCFGNPRHMSAAIDKFQYRLPYGSIFGGVSALSRKEFETVNGFSNQFFGWGGEDDDMWNRIHFNKLKVVRYPMNIARYKMIKHGTERGNKANDERFRLLRDGKKRYKKDGINSLHYKVIEKEFRDMYTWVSVSINETEVLQS